MSITSLPCIAVSLFALASLAACSVGSSASDDSIVAGESNYTSEAGAPASDASATSDATVEVAPFVIADASSVTPKLRFSVDGAPAVDAYDPQWTTLISGTDRRFKLQGATPVQGGKPVFYVEFGRGAAFIEKGTYDCAASEVIALIVDTDGTKKLTVVDGAAQRACKVVIDDAVDFVPLAGIGARPRSWRNVIGHVEATVGDRTNAASETKSVRAAFAVSVIEN
jgi:hypothetical protein